MLYDIIASELGPILFGHNGRGLQRVHFLASTKPLPRDEGWRKTGRDALLQETKKQLRAYLKGALREFSIPLALEGTPFQQRVWQTLTTIPYASTWSYKELASAVGNPAACRAVGNANGKNKLSILVP